VNKTFRLKLAIINQIINHGLNPTIARILL